MVENSATSPTRALSRPELQSLIGTVILIFAATLFAFLTTRWLPPSERGVIVVLLTSSSLLMLLGSFGVATGGRRLVATGRELTAGSYLKRARTLTVIHVLTTSTLGIAVLALSGGLANWMAAIGLVALGPMALFGYMCRECLHGVGRHVAATYVDVVPAAFMLAFVCVVHLTVGLTLTWALAAVVLGGVAELAYTWTQTHRYRLPASSVGSSSLGVLIRLSLPALGSSLGMALVVRGDRLVLGALTGTTAVGIYGLAATFTELMWVVPMTFAQFAFRRASIEPETAARSRAWLPLLATTAAMAVSIVFVGRILIDEFFGASYLEAEHLLPLLAVAAIPMASFHFDSAALNGLGEFRTVARITYAGASALFVACFALIPLLGTVGAALASILAYGIMGVSARMVLLAGARRKTHTPSSPAR